MPWTSTGRTEVDCAPTRRCDIGRWTLTVAALALTVGCGNDSERAEKAKALAIKAEVAAALARQKEENDRISYSEILKHKAFKLINT